MSDAIKDLDDIDDELFIRKKPQNYIFADKKAQDVTERTSKILNNTRSIVQETEQVGQSTLEMLSSQRETLERVEVDLDSINTMTRATQKHLTNMRSFFGGIKSLFSSSNNSALPNPALKATLPRSNTLASMPSNIPASSSNQSSSMGSSNKSIVKPTSSERQNYSSTSANKLPKEEDEFEANLSELGFGLGRLKDMAMKLGDEIGDHNEMLDRITEKSERASDSLKHQDRQMQQLLKKG